MTDNVYAITASETVRPTADMAIDDYVLPESYVAASHEIVVTADSCPDGNTDHHVGCCTSVGHCVSGCGAAITTREAALPSTREELPTNFCYAPTAGIVTIPNEPPPRRSA